MTVKREIEASIKALFFKCMDQQINKIRACALLDLYDGPYSAKHYREVYGHAGWPGYAKAIRRLEEWAAENITDVWIGEDGDITLQEPDDPAEYAKYDTKQIRLIVFGKLVTDGGMS